MAQNRGAEEIDAVVVVSGAMAPIERIALQLMAQMAIDAIGEPLTVQVDLGEELSLSE